MGSTIYRVAFIVLLSALSKGELPEDDFRIIHRQDTSHEDVWNVKMAVSERSISGATPDSDILASNTDIFQDNDTVSFSQLLFDVARDQLIVGARDALYRLSLRDLHALERASWPATADKTRLCQIKGQSPEDCHNYIKVLLSGGHKLLACGTHAFSPECSWREIESINTVTESMSGIAHCPYNPHSNVTALLAGTGEYYVGTPTDFSSSDFAIARSRDTTIRDNMLRTTQYDLNWLNEPQFVGSFEDDYFVYFVYREIAVEHMNCGNMVYSRIARVCKNDSGGGLMMKNNWSTFLKARLTCSVPGEVPFYYDEVQSVEYLAQEKILVATFTTPVNSITGSAVCMYNMSDIHKTFDGPFKVQQSPISTWEQRTPPPQIRMRFRCGEARSHEAMDYNRYHLMYDPIEPLSRAPVYRLTSERLTHVTVDVTSAKNIDKQYVLFAATEAGSVLKLAVLPTMDGAYLVEKWMLKDEGFDILKMQFVKETMSVYVGSTTSILRIGSERCARYSERGACARAADPHCGWDVARDLCVRAAARLRDNNFLQDTSRYPDEGMQVDGGWSSWSEWEACMQDGTSHSEYGDKPDMCMCRTRTCNNPRPANGGHQCKGVSVAVTNCTVHGGWSSWSGWSQCSATCGLAMKSRRRTCTSPEPKYGGRVCVGVDVDDVYCANQPPCPDPALAPVDGGWSAWSAWSPCESAGGAGCGPAAGWRDRRRTCTNPAPAHGGSPCDGSKVERQVCDMRPCEMRKATAWTPWVMIPGNTSDGSYSEKRFKFLCRAPSPEQIKLSIAREEDRYCTVEGACSSTPPVLDARWGAWGAWGACSAPCGGGQQARARACLRPPCAGPADMLRPCNTHACQGEWSCWTEWSECSGTCSGGASAAGHRTRTRKCLSPEGCNDATAALERRACLTNCADSEAGWGEWGEWGACENGERVRQRSCESGACLGAQLQAARCGDNDDMDNELYAMPAYTQNVEMASFVTMSPGESLSVGSIIGCVVAAFVMGCLLCLAVVIYCQRRGSRMPWKRNHRVPSSPHYITAKQNSYVTVPLKEVPRKAKRQPSFSGIGGSSGLILSKSNNLSNANNHNTAAATPKLYPKAIANEYDSVGTLRRHSNQPNNKSNIDVEEDKFY